MTLVPPTRRYDYVTDGLEIYRRSFGMIRDEADFRDFAPDLVTVATRIIHGAGDVDIVSALAATDDLVSRARAALEAGAPIFTDSHMLASGVTRIGTLAFDRAGKVVRIGEGPPLSLPAREFRLLEILVGHVGRVVSKDDIASQLFAFDDDAGENAIELYIGRLRRKLGDALVIRTLRGIGYLVQAPGTDDGA